jgi:hypothetical protein
LTKALDDLLATLEGLNEAVERLERHGSMVGSSASRSSSALTLNGLRVGAFASLEDYLRRRTYEAVCWLGQQVPFESLTDALRQFILEETIKGLAFSLQRDDNDRVTTIQLQGLLIGASSEVGAPFEPSEYFFGKSASNISKGHVKAFLDALDIEAGFGALSEIAHLVGMQHIGQPSDLLHQLALARHSSAHSFPSDYKLSEFKTQLSSGLPLVAFTYDTCVSQCVLSIKNAIASNHKPSKFNASNMHLRKFEFDLSASGWNEFRCGTSGSTLTRTHKKNIDVRIQSLRSGAARTNDTIVKVGSGGKLESWYQPIP